MNADANIWPNYEGALSLRAFYKLGDPDVAAALPEFRMRHPKVSAQDVLISRGSADDFREPCAFTVAGCGDMALLDCRESHLHVSAYVFVRKEPRLTMGWGEYVQSMTNVMGALWASRWIVTRDVFDVLSDDRFTNVSLRPCVVKKNESSLTVPDRLWLLQSLSPECTRPARVTGVENVCPFCGQAPVVCPACGKIDWKCPECAQMTEIQKRSGADDKRLLKCEFKDRRVEVIDGSRWDGSDVINLWGGLAVSRRVVEKLLAIHAGPFAAEPIAVWTDNMTADQKEQLDEVSRPLRD